LLLARHKPTGAKVAVSLETVDSAMADAGRKSFWGSKFIHRGASYVNICSVLFAEEIKIFEK